MLQADGNAWQINKPLRKKEDRIVPRPDVNSIRWALWSRPGEGNDEPRDMRAEPPLPAFAPRETIPGTYSDQATAAKPFADRQADQSSVNQHSV